MLVPDDDTSVFAKTILPIRSDALASVQFHPFHELTVKAKENKIINNFGLLTSMPETHLNTLFKKRISGGGGTTEIGEKGNASTRYHFNRRMTTDDVKYPDDKDRHPFEQIESVELASQMKFIPAILSGFRKQPQPKQFNYSSDGSMSEAESRPPSIRDDDPPNSAHDSKMFQSLKSYETRARKLSGCSRIKLTPQHNHGDILDPSLWPCCKWSKSDLQKTTRKYLKVKNREKKVSQCPSYKHKNRIHHVCPINVRERNADGNPMIFHFVATDITNARGARDTKKFFQKSRGQDIDPNSPLPQRHDYFEIGVLNSHSSLQRTRQKRIEKNLVRKEFEAREDNSDTDEEEISLENELTLVKGRGSGNELDSNGKLLPSKHKNGKPTQTTRPGYKETKKRAMLRGSPKYSDKIPQAEVQHLTHGPPYSNVSQRHS